MRTPPAPVAAAGTGQRARAWWRGPRGRLAAVWRVGVTAPVCVVALGLVLTAGIYYVRWGFGQDGIPPRIAFVDAGARFAPRIGLGAQVVAPQGYDGQFAYYLALHPELVATCAYDHAHCPFDDPALRSERILYPLAARLLALGQPGAIPFALFLIDFLAILLTTGLVARLGLEAGASRWLGAAAGLFCGEALALVRDLTDPFAVLWTVLAVWLLRRGRPLLGAAAVAAALLTREQLALVLPLLALPLILQRRWLPLAASALIGLGPFVAWQAVLHQIYGVWPLIHTARYAPTVPIPFLGLIFAGFWLKPPALDVPLMVAFVAVPVALAFVIAVGSAVGAFRRAGPRAIAANPVPLVVAAYAALVSITGLASWVDLWAPARLAAPALLLGLVVASDAPRPLRLTYVGLLALSALAPLLMAVTRF